MIVLTVFSGTSNSLAYFPIDIVGSFLIVDEQFKKSSIRFLFNPSLSLFLKNLFFCKFVLCFVYGRQRNCGLVSALSKLSNLCCFFSCSFILGGILRKKKCLNNRTNHENLDLSIFFSKIGLIRRKIKVLKIIPYFASAPSNYIVCCIYKKECSISVREQI